MSRVSFTVPLTPPSVNHYKVRYRNGNTVVSKEALAFKDALCIFGRGQFVQSRKFQVGISITLGAKERGDIDNFPKLVMDGLADAGVFRNLKGERVSDAYVRSLLVTLDCDTRPERGQTHITVEGLNDHTNIAPDARYGDKVANG